MVKSMNIQQLNIISTFKNINPVPKKSQGIFLNSLKSDAVSFTGSKPYDYKTTFSYMASEILKEKQKNNINTRPKNIDKAVGEIAGEYKSPNQNYYKYSESVIEKNTFPVFYNESLKENITDSINESREAVFTEWKNALTGKNPGVLNHSVSKKLEDPVARFVIWEGINYGIRENNRHIPPPFNADVLDRTIDYFQNDIKPEERGLKAQSIKYFSKVYNSMLIDSLLTDIIKNPKYSNYKIYDSDGKEIDKSKLNSVNELGGIWIKIPSLKRAKTYDKQSINALEVLSHENWCTRTRENKAKTALEAGSFYIYLKKEPFNSGYDIRTPEIAITSSNGKIERIQGQLNNNDIPQDKIDLILKFLSERNCIHYDKNGSLKNHTLTADYKQEGPQSYYQVLIACLKKDFNSDSDLDDTQSVFTRLFPNKISGFNEDGLILKSYDSKTHIHKDISIPVSMAGFDEDVLLSSVSEIQTVFDMRNSALKSFPKNLKSVGKKVICTKEQFEKYGPDIMRVLKNQDSEINPVICEKNNTIYIYKK